MDNDNRLAFTADTIFLLTVKEPYSAPIIVTWRPTRESAEDFARIYNLNRYSGTVEIEEAKFL